MKYDYLIVGAGLFGATFAYEANKRGKKCLVVDKRNHIGGNIYSENIEEIEVHKYGPHIFHTKDKKIWEYINQFTEFNNFVHSPIAKIMGEIYNLPFNMNTFSKMWGIETPDEARRIILKQRPELHHEPKNIEEQALSLVGRDIYEKLIKGYTEKQWGRPCSELPAFIIRRLPLRFIYDNNYYNDQYQGIPVGGYTKIIEKMLDGIDIELSCNFFEKFRGFKAVSNKLVFTGMIDEYFDYEYGPLEYRSLFFKEEVLEQDNYQGVAVVNYTGLDFPYTRIIEHKHFVFGNKNKTVITREYPDMWSKGKEAYYPINDNKNNLLAKKYKILTAKEKDVIFGGRLGSYEYFDMDQAIKISLECVYDEFEKRK
jgi:UDP-galactopyranose mutase